MVQHNLVYAVGLPLDICNEDMLKGGDYFGQFGKVVKVRCLVPLAEFANNQQLSKRARMLQAKLCLSTLTSDVCPDHSRACFSSLLCQGLACSSRVLGCKCGDLHFICSMFGLWTRHSASHSKDSAVSTCHVCGQTLL